MKSNFSTLFNRIMMVGWITMFNGSLLLEIDALDLGGVDRSSGVRGNSPALVV